MWQRSIWQQTTRTNKDPYQFRNQYKNNKPETITIILQCLPNHFTIQHVFGWQNKTERFINYANLNMNTDHLAITSASILVNIHISSVPFAVYVKTKYINNKVDHKFRQQSHTDEARKFRMKKYKWSTKPIKSIDWDSQRNIINKLPTRYNEHFCISFITYS